MTVTIRFFARYRELLGASVEVDEQGGPDLYHLVQDVVRTNSEASGLIFDDQGNFNEFVILVLNKSRIEPGDARGISLQQGDEVAVFPPVSGG